MSRPDLTKSCILYGREETGAVPSALIKGPRHTKNGLKRIETDYNGEVNTKNKYEN